jgi:hypothetical protein
MAEHHIAPAEAVDRFARGGADQGIRTGSPDDRPGDGRSRVGVPVRWLAARPAITVLIMIVVVTIVIMAVIIVVIMIIIVAVITVIIMMVIMIVIVVMAVVVVIIAIAEDELAKSELRPAARAEEGDCVSAAGDCRRTIQVRCAGIVVDRLAVLQLDYVLWTERADDGVVSALGLEHDAVR